MSTLARMMYNTRTLLGNPKANCPTASQVLYAVLRVAQSLHNKATNTGQAWDVREYVLPVGNNVEDYLLPVSGQFGKPLQIVTIDPSNPIHIERPIGFREVENLDLNFIAPRNIGWWNWSPDGSNHTALWMAFMRQGSQVWVRVKPVPQLSCQYRITYSVGDWASDAGLGDSPIMPDHHHLIEVRAGKALLPLCEWDDDEDYNGKKREGLWTSLSDEETEYARDFATGASQLHHNRIVSMNSFHG